MGSENQPVNSGPLSFFSTGFPLSAYDQPEEDTTRQREDTLSVCGCQPDIYSRHQKEAGGQGRPLLSPQSLALSLSLGISIEDNGSSGQLHLLVFMDLSTGTLNCQDHVGSLFRHSSSWLNCRIYDSHLSPL